MRLQDHLPQGLRVPGTLIASVLAIIIASVFVFSSLSAITGSMTESSVTAQDADVVSQLLANNKVLDQSDQRFTGRSIFYIPREPRRPSPPPRPVVQAPPPPPPPPVVTPEPTIPSSYAGPSIQSILGNEVFFEGDLKITQGATENGVKVLMIHGPFDVRLGWQGGEYDVQVFSQDLPDFFTSVPFADGQTSNLLTVDTTTRPTTTTASRSSSSSREELMERMRNEQLARQGGAAPGSSGERPPAEIPEPITQSQIDEMSRMDAVRANSAIGRALREDLDDATRERLMKESEKLRERIRKPNAD